VIGGSSSINAMMWVRGAPAPTTTTGDIPGWSYDEVLPYFHRIERRNGSNTDGTYGTEGPALDQRPGANPNPLDRRVPRSLRRVRPDPACPS